MRNKKIRSVLLALVVLISAVGAFTGGALAAHDDSWSADADSEYDIVVDKSGGEDYASLQEAVDNASSGDKIKVKSGTYEDSDGTNSAYVAVIDKQLTLHFADGATVDGGTQTNGLKVTANDVVVKGVDYGTAFGSSSTLTMVDDVDGVDITSYTQEYAKHNVDITTVSATIHIDDSDGDGANVDVDGTESWWSTTDASTIDSSFVLSNADGITGDVTFEPYFETSSMETLSNEGSLDVTATDTDGNNITGYSITVEDADNNVVHDVEDVSSNPFSISDLDEGDYTVTVNHPEYGQVQKSVTITAGSTTSSTFELSQSTGSAEITVEDPNGDAYSGATVELQDSSGSVVASGDTGTEGLVTFNDVVVGDYDVVIKNSDYQNVNDGSISIEDGQTTTQTYTLEDFNDLTVNVEDSDGNAVTDATVTVTDADGNQVGSEAVDSSGQADFTGLSDGDYTVDVATDSYEDVSKEITVNYDTTALATMYTSASDSTSSITVTEGGTTDPDSSGGGALFGGGAGMSLGALVLLGGAAWLATRD